MRFGRWLRPALLFTDCLIFNLFFWITLLIYPDALVHAAPEWVLWLILNVSLIPVMIYSGRFKNKIYRAILLDRVMLSSLAAVGFHALFFLSIIALFDVGGLPTHVYLTYYGMLIVVQNIWALTSRIIIKKYRRKGFNYITVVIVGTDTGAARLYHEMMIDPGYGYKVVAFFDTDPHESTFLGHPCYDIRQLAGFMKDSKVDQIYYTLPGNDDRMADTVKIADDNVAEFFYVPVISQFVARNFVGESIGAVQVMPIRNNPLKLAVNAAAKRAFDIAFSSVFLIFYPPIYLTVAAIIKITSPGPVYFKQLRTGYKGQPFVCLKFRSMNVNDKADEKQAVLGDPRITRFGDFLRRSSIDELPQFINVFKGDMSIVGPRPHMLKHTEEYAKLIDRYMVRHLIRPGITGWAQVNGYRGQTDELWKMEKRVENDVWYIEHWSFLLDLKIIVRTVLNAFRHDENAR